MQPRFSGAERSDQGNNGSIRQSFRKETTEPVRFRKAVSEKFDRHNCTKVCKNFSTG